MRLLLLKSAKFANQAGYYLHQGRWHKVSDHKPAPKGAPVSAHPHAAGAPVKAETLADHEWSQLQLPAENVNAKTFNKQLDQLKAAASAGDVTGIVASGYGTNTYGKKLAIIANHVLGLLGSDHKVTPGQKAGEHAAVQTAPEIEAGAPEPKTAASAQQAEKPTSEAPKPAPEQEKVAPAAEKKTDQKLAVPDFAEGVKAKGVKAHYEKVAKKIIRAANAGDLSALQFMVNPDKGNTWKGKTDNSKALLALHAQAVEHAQGVKGPGKDIQHPDAEKQAATEAKELAKEKVTPEPKPKAEPAPEPEPKKFKNFGWKAIELAKHYTIPELEAAMKDVEAEHKGTGTGIQLYDKAGQKKLDALTWAITHIAGAEKKAAAEKPKPAAEVTPKEGETKQGADGTLVFKDGRWHKQETAAPAAEAKQAAPGAAANLSQIPWDGMLLPDSNKNAKSHNKQVAKIKAMAEAGDIEGLKNFKAGTNTYGKKQNLLAQTALAALEEGSAAPAAAPAPTAEAKPAPAEKPKDEAAAAAKPAADEKPQMPKSGNMYLMNEIEDAMLDAEDDKLVSLIKKTSGSAANYTAHQYAKAAYKYLMGKDYVGPEAEQPETAASSAPEIPQPPKIKDFNTNHVANIWKKMASEGKVAELMASIETLAKNAQKSPKSFSSDDAQALLGYAKEMAKWVSATGKSEPGAEAKPAEKQPAPTHDASGKPIKPTGLSSVGWTAVVNEIEEKLNAKDVFPIAQHAKQTEGLTSPEAKQVHDYANNAVEFLFAQAAKDFPLDDDGPKEGETKQGADGMLVFQNGRWHKMGDDGAPADKAAAEKPAPAGPAGVEIPTFNGPNAKHNELLGKLATALKEKVVAEGKAGLKQPITNHKDGSVSVYIPGVAKLKKVSLASATSGFADFAKFVDELKASVGAQKAKAKPQPTPAPVSEPAQPQPVESMDSWTQTGGQGGSNPGGKFKDADGVEWYCKFPADEHIAKAEVLAAKLYGALGLHAQDAKLVTKDGKIGIASKWQTVTKASPKELANTPGVLEGFAADAWLANWDVVGMAYDNLQVGENGHAMRVDAGGSLMYRAQGSKKAFGDAVTELDTLRDAKLNPQAAAVFGGMSEADITASVAKVAQITDAQIRILVNANGPGDKAERKALAETLIARKNDLIAKYPKAVKVKKKRLDPENLPVKEERLPKAHDFANWNGPGAGLSSKAVLNEANQKVESEMLAIAKSGNLNKLKEFKFRPVSISTGQPFGDALPIAQHPSKHVQQFHQDLVMALDEVANPPQPLKIFQESDLNTLDELDMAFPSKKFGTTVNTVHSNEKMGFWVVLGGVHKAAEKFTPKNITHFTQQAISAAYEKFKEGSKLAKHFVLSVQASGSYNDLFREGKEFDGSGNKLSDVAKAAEEFATEQPEGTTVYRWQHMTKDMVDKIMSAPDGTVFQATGPMCTSMSPTATSHFGPHRIKITYAKGAKAVESFGSGKFAGEKEVTTLPNSRFVILKKEMVPGGSGKRMELEVLMLPPDLGL